MSRFCVQVFLAAAWPEVRLGACWTFGFFASQRRKPFNIAYSGPIPHVDATGGHRMTSPSAPLRAVLLDPHPLWLDAIELVLDRVGVEVVGKTSSGTEALNLVEQERPDLLTVEIDPLPGEPGGLDVLRQACSSSPTLRAIVLSTHHDTGHIDGALTAGAAAYVVKTAHSDDVASAIRQ